MYEEVINNCKTIAIIIRNSFSEDGIRFFTPTYFSQQLAFMKHPTGRIISPHFHNIVKREVQLTQEVIFIKRGLLRVDFYDDEKVCIKSRVLGQGDVILLASGGHGFKVLEDIEMIEVKQGPFAGDADKTKFLPKRECHDTGK